MLGFGAIGELAIGEVKKARYPAPVPPPPPPSVQAPEAPRSPVPGPGNAWKRRSDDYGQADYQYVFRERREKIPVTIEIERHPGKRRQCIDDLYITLGDLALAEEEAERVCPKP